MAAQLVECIPNFSEARRPEVVEEIVRSIQEVKGTHILDRHSDQDHNRTVITFVGEPQIVEEAAFRSIATASRLIDLNQHLGGHPRIGATDVMPFVPISGISMVECVEMARRLGKRVGGELDLPVYLYEQAASRPDRQNLENIRHGQYEGLKEDILINPDRKPDFGPAKLGPAGATVIGARYPLIAFNVYLTTTDVSIAQKIAKAVRHSSGGMRYVKALGLLVDGRAQVSMNLTNYEQTPIARVVEMVRREAQRYGVGIHHSELVGLTPQAALRDAALWYLQLDHFEPEQILEDHLYQKRTASVEPVEEKTAAPDFLEQLASAAPAPGGGSAAAHTGAAAAALVAMVARLTIGKKKYALVESRMSEIVQRAEVLRSLLSEAVERDAAGFANVMASYQLPKNTPAEKLERERAIQEATLKAAEVPMEVVCLSVEVMTMAGEVAATGNQNAISDAASAVALARAAVTSAALNVRINLRDAKGQGGAISQNLEELAGLEKKASAVENNLRETLLERVSLPF